MSEFDYIGTSPKLRVSEFYYVRIKYYVSNFHFVREILLVIFKNHRVENQDFQIIWLEYIDR